MAITVTHPTAAIEPGDGDPNKIQPEDWNMNHTVTGTVDIANGGTGANSEAGARTNLGLGTIATQNSNNVSITGGSIAGVTIAGLDANTTFQDNVDPTKQMRFELSGVSAGQTRILTVPDFDGTVATLAGAESLTNKTLVDTTNLEVTNLKAKDGTAAGTIADSTGVVTLASSVLTTTDINGGTIDGTTQASGTINGPIAAGGTWTAAATWTLPAVTLGGTVTSNGQSFSGTIANLGTVTTADINGGTIDGVTIGASVAPTVTNLGSVATCDINGGTIDGTTIGGASAAAGTFTTLTSTGNATLGDNPATDTHTINGGLTIKNTGTGNCLLIEDSASPDSTPVVIDASGYVVLGDTTPRTQGGYAARLQIAGANSVSVGSIANTVYFPASAAGPRHFFYKSRGSNFSSLGIVSSGDTLGALDFYGDDGASFIPAASIIAAVDSAPSTGIVPGRVTISTANSSGTLTEALRIDANGNVGIGIAPSANIRQYNYLTASQASTPEYGAFFQTNGTNTTGASNKFGVGGITYSAAGAAANTYYGAQGDAVQGAAVTTGNLIGVSGRAYTIAAGTIAGMYGFSATVANSGGATISVAVGYSCNDITVGTSNYGYYSAVSSGANKWNFCAVGTAANYFGGNVTANAAFNQTPTRSTVGSGSTITLTTSTNHLLYDNAATAAALTVTLPSSSLTDGQTITISTRSEITSLTVNGGTIYGAPTTLAAGGFASFIYSSGGTAWFRKG